MYKIMNIIIICVNFIFSGVVYRGLPEIIPVHYGALGAPDNWSEKTILCWYLLPITAVIMTLIFAGCASLATSSTINPKYLSIPKKDGFLSMSAEKKGIVYELIKTYCYKVMAFVNVFFLYAQFTNYMVSLERWPGMSFHVFILLILLLIFVTIDFIVSLNRTIAILIKEKRS